MVVEHYEALKQGWGAEVAKRPMFIAKGKRGPLGDHIPQLIGEMYDSAVCSKCVGDPDQLLCTSTFI